MSKPVESPEELRAILDFMAIQSKVADRRTQNQAEYSDFSSPVKVDYVNLVGESVARAFTRSNFVPVVVDGVGTQYAVTKRLECF